MSGFSSGEVYNKPPKNNQFLLEQLKSRGLIIGDEKSALHSLRHIGYYRLIGYLRWFQHDLDDRKNHVYQDGVTFEQIIEHYDFDRELRILTLDAIERLEVAFKAAISNHMCLTTNDPHWFLTKENFLLSQKPKEGKKLVSSHEYILLEIEKQVTRNKKQKFIKHYFLNYRDPRLPHSWAVFEIFDFGLTSKIYQILKPQDRDNIAALFGYKRATIESWMRALSTLRNFCAHHSRIWNNALPNEPNLPTELAFLLPCPTENPTHFAYVSKRFFAYVITIKALLKTVQPESIWFTKLNNLFDKYPTVSIAKLGFPKDWFSEPFWAMQKPSVSSTPLQTPSSASL